MQDLEHNSRSSIFRAVSYGTPIFRCFMIASSWGSPSLPFRGPSPPCICCSCQPHSPLSFLTFFVISMSRFSCQFSESSQSHFQQTQWVWKQGTLFELMIIIFELSLEIKGCLGIDVVGDWNFRFLHLQLRRERWARFHTCSVWFQEPPVSFLFLWGWGWRQGFSV